MNKRALFRAEYGKIKVKMLAWEKGLVNFWMEQDGRIVSKMLNLWPSQLWQLQTMAETAYYHVVKEDTMAVYTVVLSLPDGALSLAISADYATRAVSKAKKEAVRLYIEKGKTEEEAKSLVYQPKLDFQVMKTGESL